MIGMICLAFAFVLFIIAAFSAVNPPRIAVPWIHPGWLGAAFVVVYLLLGSWR